MSALRRAAGLGLLGFLGLGCVALAPSGPQEVRLSASPPDAKLSIHRLTGERIFGPTDVSTAPLRIPRPEGEPYLFVFTREGYCPAYRIGRLIRGGRVGEYATDAYSIRVSLRQEGSCLGR